MFSRSLLSSGDQEKMVSTTMMNESLGTCFHAQFLTFRSTFLPSLFAAVKEHVKFYGLEDLFPGTGLEAAFNSSGVQDRNTEGDARRSLHGGREHE